MKTTVSRTWLIYVMGENRNRHRATFLKAFEKYREKVTDLLEQKLDAVKNNKRFDLFFGLVEPKDQTDDYDRVIGMLRNSVDDNIVLDENDYSCYVLDKWGWKLQWSATNSAYGVVEDD